MDIDGKPHVLRFADRLRTLLINGHPFKTDFGGMPMLIYVNGYKHFLRLSTLPQGVRPGRVDIWNMIGNEGPGGGPRNSPNHGEEETKPYSKAWIWRGFGKNITWQKKGM